MPRISMLITPSKSLLKKEKKVNQKRRKTLHLPKNSKLRRLALKRDKKGRSRIEKSANTDMSWRRISKNCGIALKISTHI